MTTATLAQVEQMVDQLGPVDQARLLEYLAPRVRSAVTAMETRAPSTEEDLVDGWGNFFRVGEEIAKLPTVGEETMTQSVFSMRR